MGLVDDTSAAAIAAVLDQVGARLKRLRTHRRMTLTGVAEATGISKSTPARLETDNDGPPWNCSSRCRMPIGYRWTTSSPRWRRAIRGQDWVLRPGEVASFDTTVPHWFGSTGDEPAEILSIFGRPGERMTVRTTSPPA